MGQFGGRLLSNDGGSVRLKNKLYVRMDRGGARRISEAGVLPISPDVGLAVRLAMIGGPQPCPSGSSNVHTAQNLPIAVRSHRQRRTRY